MAEESTNTTTPAVPDWAQDALDTFARLAGQSHGHLTPVEADLFDAAWLALRARFGQTEIIEPATAVRTLVRDALANLDEQARS